MKVKLWRGVFVGTMWSAMCWMKCSPPKPRDWLRKAARPPPSRALSGTAEAGPVQFVH